MDGEADATAALGSMKLTPVKNPVPLSVTSNVPQYRTEPFREVNGTEKVHPFAVLPYVVVAPIVNVMWTVTCFPILMYEPAIVPSPKDGATPPLDHVGV